MQKLKMDEFIKINVTAKIIAFYETVNLLINLKKIILNLRKTKKGTN